MALGNILSSIGGSIQTARNVINKVGLPTPIQVATGAFPGAAGVASSLLVAQIEREKRRKAELLNTMSLQSSAARTAANTLENRAMGAPILMAGSGNSNILTDLGQTSSGPPQQQNAARSTGFLENIGGNISFGTQSKNQPLLIVGGIVVAILIALGIRSSLGPGKRRRR